MSEIKNVTVVGSGVLGAQIAFVTAHAGFTVTAWDINDEAVAAATKRFDAIGSQVAVELEGASAETVAAARERLSITTDVAAAVKDADLVIEAVPENLDLKRDVWAKIGAAAPADAIFCTNSSTLLPSDFADSTGAPERFLALHFANHIWIQNTAEIMPHPGTNLDLLPVIEKFALDIRMVPIVLKKQQPGYVLNTLLVPWLKAGQYLLAEGIAEPEQIDRDWKNSTGAPKGPFEVMDLVGLRTVVAVGDQPGAPEWQKKFLNIAKAMIAEGKTGVESGEGFYKYA